ncbi:hypothetical protein GCM10022419_059780 [Nonomuraea rosea]|uniref:Uncharacterized protein n=1 Tax=Nonomuraea rosea TaxID=638574 RepID=A0ABP6XRB4_9ACTN
MREALLAMILRTLGKQPEQSEDRSGRDPGSTSRSRPPGGSCQRIVAAYRNPDRASAKTDLAKTITVISAAVPTDSHGP